MSADFEKVYYSAMGGAVVCMRMSGVAEKYVRAGGRKAQTCGDKYYMLYK